MDCMLQLWDYVKTTLYKLCLIISFFFFGLRLCRTLQGSSSHSFCSGLFWHHCQPGVVHVPFDQFPSSQSYATYISRSWSPILGKKKKSKVDWSNVDLETESLCQDPEYTWDIWSLQTFGVLVPSYIDYHTKVNSHEKTIYPVSIKTVCLRFATVN